uniref:C2 domain-containing protein n=1 Tax=Echinostoma caproni TaxID=27848 RepID=A0A183B5V1_9TREM
LHIDQTIESTAVCITFTWSYFSFRLQCNSFLVLIHPAFLQIRVKVVEARQLQGGNVSPVCRITCWNRTEETHVKNSTNSPYWNEIFFFNYHEAPATLLDQAIRFSVFNSRHLRKDALIGSFKFDLAIPYEEKQHSMINKWLLLSNPDDPMAGAKGYLKISIVILGPGDEAPSMNPLDSEGDEDIEANLLRPAGVQLRPAVFKIRLYKAEDLPRMDPETFKGLKNLMSNKAEEQKEYADPYMILSFAGKTLKSSTKYGTDHPEWNEEMTMNLQVSYAFNKHCWSSYSCLLFILFVCDQRSKVQKI